MIVSRSSASRAFLVAFAFAFALAACGRSSPLGVGHTGAGGSAGAASGGAASGGAGDASGGASGEGADGGACVAETGCPPACGTLSEADCLLRSDCRADDCPGCGVPFFNVCSPADSPAPPCDPLPCIIPCSTHAAEKDCDADFRCHSVFGDPGTCDCATAGCCLAFSHCSDGPTAVCAAQGLLCKSIAPTCAGDYTVAYASNCYDGCVLKTECFGGAAGDGGTATARAQ